jgi:glycosyltransferase involved in cell wall biosynthesis
MAEAIIRLLEDDALRSRMGQAALDHARGHFAIEQLVDGTVDIYEALLAARAGATQPPAS